MKSTWCSTVLLVAILISWGTEGGENGGDFKALRAIAKPEPATGPFAAQLLGELDRPVGEALKLAGLTIPARVGDKGQLELDLKSDGKFSTYRSDQPVSLNLPREGAKQPLAVRVLLKKGADGSWTYRNMTQLGVRIENDQLVIIDANGNGLYNEAGVDGIAPKDQIYFFPLPAADERWCTLTQEFTGLTLGPWGEDLKVNGRPLATHTPAALNVLKGVIEERLKLGLTPRPEDPKLSADLQKHCAYMSANSQLTHPEEKGKAGYSQEGNDAGMRSILGMGTSAGQVANRMVQTYFHRIDVVRPDTQAFGVGYEGKYSGIDGRTNMLSSKPANLWPVLCPAPGQEDLATTYAKEMPDATPGDDKAGYPITVQFHTGKLKLTSHKLRVVPPGSPAVATKAQTEGPSIECYTFDPHTGASSGMTGYLRCVCVMAKDPLQGGTEYEVSMEVEVDGKPWTRTWRFTTQGGRKRR